MVYVYGGSFNPPTLAHKEIVETLLKQDPTCQVIVIPVGNDYQKTGLIDVNHRINMLQCTFSDDKRIIISKLEVERSYEGTLSTLYQLSQSYDDLCYVIGSDQLPEIKTWINYKALLKTYPFVIMMRDHMRPDEAEEYVKGLTHDFKYMPFNRPAASTDIRRKKSGYEKYLDPKVLSYIKEHQLYEE